MLPARNKDSSAKFSQIDFPLLAPSFTLTNSMPSPVPRLREYFRSCGLFQCSWTPRLVSRLVAVAWAGS